MNKKLLSLFWLLCPLFFVGQLSAQGGDYMMVGTFNGWSFEQSPLVFNYVETTANGDVYTASTTSIYGDWKIVKDHSWTDALGGAGTNMQVGNEYNLTKGGANSGFANGYVVRNATFTLTVSDSGNAKIKVEGTAGEEHSYGVVGNFQGWNAASAPLMEEKSDGSFYIEIDNFPGAQEFKISIDKSWTCFLAQNGKTTLTFGEAYTCARDDNDNNFTVGESGQTYKVGMTLVVASDAQSAQLTVANLSESGQGGETQTYTCTFINGANWNEVCAYTYNPVLNGAWPGTQLEKTGTTTKNGVEYDVYTYSIESATAPTKIIFNNNNNGSQTGDLDFVNGKEYDDMVPALTHTYVIAGEEALMGESWNANSTTNAMTEENGTWTLTKENVTLLPGEYGYKLVEDGNTWIPDPGDNHILVIDEIGVYTVVFTMTEPTDAGYSAEATKDDSKTFSFSVRGSNGALFGNAWWENAEGDAANPMVISTDGKYVFTKSAVQLTAGEIQYRVAVNGDYVTAAPFNINGIQNNNSVTLEKDGTYDVTITFDPAAKTVTETLVREAAEVKNYTVTFVNSGNWEGDIYVWAWREGKNFNGDTFPGMKATKTENKAGNFDIWTYTFEQLSEDDLPTSIIFSANGDPQTQDLVFADNGEYWGVDKYGLEGTAFGGFKDDAQYRGIERILTDEGNGVYTYREENVALEAVAYPYRVSKNGKFVTNTGIGGVDGNKEFIPEAAGNYDITVTLTNTDSKKDVEVTLTPAGVVTEAKYYIVGEEDLLGFAWAADEANELTFNGDAWTLTKSNLTLTARDYEYKLLKVEGETQTWIPDTQENKILTIQEDGEYNVYFTMAEPTDNGYWALAEKIDEPTETYTVYYVDQQGWGNPLMKVWGGTTTTTGLNEAKSSKEVKAWGNTYTQFEYEVTGTPDGILFAKDNAYSKKTSDMAFVPGATYANDGDEQPNGIFLFTDDENIFQPETDVNVNATVSYSRVFEVGKACTVVLPFALGADKAAEAGKFYRLTSIEDGIIRGESEVPAPYVPYIFEPASEYPFTNIFVGQLPKAQVNTINAAGNAKMNFALEQTTLRSDAETAYYGWSATDGFVKLNVGLANPMRAWIEMPAAQAGANSLIWMDDVVTGINMINMEIQNGTKVYDLQGRQVTNPTARGIYIVNGKKYVVK